MDLSWLINLLPGGWLSVIGAATVATITAIATIYRKGVKRGEDNIKLEGAKARDKELDAIKRASDASRVPTNVRTDPNNRDNWKS